MPFIAIIGAGPLGGALAHKLAHRQRAGEIRLIDADESVARGKALDIYQSGPVDGSDTLISAYANVHAAIGADAIVIADAVTGAEHSGEAGLALIRQISASGSICPLVFAGSSQRELIMRSVTEVHVPPARIIGSAPLALASTMRALTAVVLDASAVDIALNVVGVPPRHVVIAWQEASVAGQPLTSAMAAHDMAALSGRVPSLWPPGPYALASAAARVTEAVCLGSRRQFSCFVDVGRGRITAMPVELRAGGIKRIIEPSLTAQERTALENAAHKSMGSS